VPIPLVICHFYDVLPQYYFLHLQIELVFDQMPEKFTGKNSVTGSVPMREPEIYELLKWYMKNVRQKILMRRKDSGDGTCKFREQIYLVSNLLFPSERGGVVCDNAFRKRSIIVSDRVGFSSRNFRLSAEREIFQSWF
jgi:hypothetical protein